MSWRGKKQAKFSQEEQICICKSVLFIFSLRYDQKICTFIAKAYPHHFPFRQLIHSPSAHILHPTLPPGSLNASCVGRISLVWLLVSHLDLMPHLNRLFVIRHTSAGVSCLSDKTLLILGCQKLWIYLKGKITSVERCIFCVSWKRLNTVICFPARHWTSRLCALTHNILITDKISQYACSSCLFG